MRTYVKAPTVATRLAAARDWLLAREPTRSTCVVAPTLVAAARLVHGLPPGHTTFGVHRVTLEGLVEALCVRELARRQLSPARRVGERALCARLVRELADAGELGHLARVADRPGLIDALSATLSELRLAGATPEQLGPRQPVLARALARYIELAEQVAVADFASRLALACEVVRERGHPWVGAPLLWLDVPLWSEAERRLFDALCETADEVLVTVAEGDPETAQRVEAHPALAPGACEPASVPLAPLHDGLFAGDAPALGPELTSCVSWTAAAGETRECVELVRRIRAEALSGRRFDAMAVAVRNGEAYRAELEDAFVRGGVPAHFARGLRRPDPAGRALLVLLRCAREGLSARRFAEYLSLGQSPVAPSASPFDDAGGPRTEAQPEPALTGPLAVYTDAAPAPAEGDDGRAAEPAIVPRRWERVLVESAVVGGLPRWQRRLQGLMRELERSRQRPDLDDAECEQLDRQLAEVRALCRFALPLLERLDGLPRQASWADWLALLDGLCEPALREPTGVRAALAELSPLGPVAPVDLDEVLRVLEQHLGEAFVPQAGLGAGQVYVGSVEDLCGMSFELMFVVGLAEKGFPRKELEDPLLLDARRRALGLPLPTLAERVARERYRLRTAVGAAERALALSYPRVQGVTGKPRVPSLYALELLRLRDGRLLDLAALLGAAERGSAARLGWPAPADPQVAIDEQEYDLSVLEQALSRPDGDTRGEGRYLLETHPGLARALRFRAMRWGAPWSSADGLVAAPKDTTLRDLLAPYRLAARPYSATALEQFAACPYRFYLRSIVGLAPRPSARPIESLGPAERGAFFHAAQRELLTALREQQRLPLDPAQLSPALEQLEAIVTRLAEHFRDELAPAIERVFDDAVAALRVELRQWLGQLAADREWVPAFFELGFGLRRDAALDSHSRAESVRLPGVLLRGAIDLVERQRGPGDGAETLRATDAKTGADVGPFSRVRGGKSLQPLLYALALEQLFPDARVQGGRLHFCTSRGGFASREVPLDARAREVVEQVLARIDAALETAFLPAAPEAGACEHCDYQPVCGPYEAQRVAQKRDQQRLEGLYAIRSRP